MGSYNFEEKVWGKTAQEAFDAAVEKAGWDYGHSGYTGTIAEKSEFVMITLIEGFSPEEYAQKLIHDGDERIDDKWGPAGCIEVPEKFLDDNEKDALKKGIKLYLFFGWASA